MFHVKHSHSPKGPQLNQEELIDRYLDLILEANETTNLTRIDSKESARLLHVEDSLVALPEINEAPDGLYGDLGTGGGFPGVPVAIMTGRKAVLVDSVRKKVAIVEKAVEKLGLNGQISTFGGRIEDLARERRGQFSVLTARALSQLPSLLELSSPLLKEGGLLVCYKGTASEEEQVNAERVAKKVGMKFVSRRSLTLSDGETHREIYVYRREGKSQVKLPRRIGLAQHNPLIN